MALPIATARTMIATTPPGESQTVVDVPSVPPPSKRNTSQAEDRLKHGKSRPRWGILESLILKQKRITPASEDCLCPTRGAMTLGR